MSSFRLICSTFVFIIASLFCWFCSYIPLFNQTKYFRKIVALGLALTWAMYGLKIRKPLNNGLPEQYILIANHISALDGLLLFGFLPNICVSALKEHEQVPIFGRILSLLNVGNIERTDLVSSAISLRRISNSIKQRKNVFMFPQGGTSIEINEFKMGAFFLAFENQIPIVPLYIKYNSVDVFYFGPPWDLLNYFKKVFKSQNKVATLSLGEPINPKYFESATHMRDYTLNYYKKTFENEELNTANQTIEANIRSVSSV